MRWKRLAACLVVLLATTHATTSRADPTPDQKAAAQALFEKGRDLVEQSHFGEACPKFAESLKLDPALGTMLWLADCLESNGQTASAWAMFSEASAVAARTHDKREQVARERVKKLTPTLSRLAILVPPGAASQGIVVERDGVAIGPAEWGVPVPVDPGVHAIAASAPGHRAWSTTVQLPARPDTLQVTVPQLDLAPAAPAASAAPTALRASAPSSPPAGGGATAPSPPAEEAPAAPPTGSAQRTIGLVVGAVGVVGLGVGAYFALHAKSVYDDAASSGHCTPDNLCDPTGKQERNDAFSQATAATIALGVGAAALVGGGVLYFTSPRGTPVAVGAAPTSRGGSAWVSLYW